MSELPTDEAPDEPDEEPADKQDLPSRRNPELGRTAQDIQRMERKVSSQWRKARGKLLAFSAGFSWRKSDLQEGGGEEEEEEETVVGRQAPSGKHRENEQQRSRARWIVAAVVLAVLGLSAWIVWTQVHKDKEVEAESLF